MSVLNRHSLLDHRLLALGKRQRTRPLLDAPHKMLGAGSAVGAPCPGHGPDSLRGGDDTASVSLSYLFKTSLTTCSYFHFVFFMAPVTILLYFLYVLYLFMCCFVIVIRQFYMQCFELPTIVNLAHE